MKRLILTTLSIGLGVAAAFLLSGLLWRAVPVAASAASMQTDIVGPPGSGRFGATVVALPNGNIVVADPLYDSGAITDVGAVYLYDGATRALISMLTGSTTGDQVGSGGVTALANGNYVVRSPNWDNGGAADAGAVTWGSGTTGITGVVTVINSLVGGAANDQVGYVTALSNGNYVVYSRYWDNSGAADAGAATWGNGTTGITGVVSVTNSLVGSTANDQVGAGVTALANGNYVVLSPGWNNGGVAGAGAATWGNGTTGITGVVTVTNSLVGSTANDQVGAGVTALANGNYVVLSSGWNNGGVAGAGAATWGNGTTGITGVVTVTNSLVGSTAGDFVSSGGGVKPLANGNYVVLSRLWDNGGVADAGAATWGNGTTGITGVVTVTNSLVGGTANDEVGGGVTALANGNYVVHSRLWDNGGVADAGAATWGNGTSGITGVVSVTNSLVGSAANDQVGYAMALSNGNYVVYSRLWDNGGVTDAGAATWGNGTTGITGVVTVTNSLVGGAAGDEVGYYGVTALANGNYVVLSLLWDNGGVTDAGAATWGNGTTGITGVVSVSNSLVGGAAGDEVGWEVKALANGNYVVLSPYWDNGGVTDAGAASWGNGTTGITGIVSVANSLVGSQASDQVGYWSAIALSDGNYVVASPLWDNGGVTDAGAATWGDGTTGIVGVVTADNSVRGTAASGGLSMRFAYDYTNDQLIVGRPADNIVTLFRPFHKVFLPLVLRNAP